VNMTPVAEDICTVTKSARIMQLIKENRIEAMVVTILLYTTGLLNQAWTYSSGVCS
jgi:hypothetical protein